MAKAKKKIPGRTHYSEVKTGHILVARNGVKTIVGGSGSRWSSTWGVYSTDGYHLATYVTKEEAEDRAKRRGPGAYASPILVTPNWNFPTDKDGYILRDFGSAEYVEVIIPSKKKRKNGDTEYNEHTLATVPLEVGGAFFLGENVGDLKKDKVYIITKKKGKALTVVDSERNELTFTPKKEELVNKIVVLDKKNVPEKPPTLWELVVLPDETKQQIEEALAQIERGKKIWKEWGLEQTIEKGRAVSMLFYGPPGTGKTMTAQAIAERLGQELKVIGSAEIQSSEPGQAERNIRAFFQAKGTVLLFDECDSLIAPRNEVGMILGAQINAVLTELEKYEGVVIFTTNRLGRLDPAFERRVSAIVEYPVPTVEQRARIWTNLIPQQCPIDDREATIVELAKVDIAGGHIKNAILQAVRYAIYRELEKLTAEALLYGVRKVLEGKTGFEKAINETPGQPKSRGRHREDFTVI